MATPNSPLPDVFLPSGGLREDLLTGEARDAMHETIRLTRATHWDTVRSPHVFMGLLAVPDDGVKSWGDKLRADLPRLLAQFQELFHQDEGEENCPLALNREFLSDNVIRLLRDAVRRAIDQKRRTVTPIDLLICLMTAKNSIVAECFERIGLTAARLTELAVMAEQSCRGTDEPHLPDPSSPDRLS
jgi:ATP-dependent Clp protease ATP-binding subunit ClpA